MAKLEMINGMSINTKHFIASVDMQNRTFAIYGDFNDTEIIKLDDPDRCQAIYSLITELSDLEETLRRMTAEDK